MVKRISNGNGNGSDKKNITTKMIDDIDTGF